MTTSAERAAHEDLRTAICAASLEQWDRRMADGQDGSGDLAETRPEVQTGVLVDYVVVAVFDSGADTHTVTAVLRTDGQCAQYRTVGLLQQALADLTG